MKGLCLIIDMLLRKDSLVKSFKFISSKVISPLVGSKYRNNKLKIVLFPFPLFPTMAIFLWGVILIV